MAATKIDEMTALVVIDLQKGIVGLTRAAGSGEIVMRANVLAGAFRGRRLPLVLSRAAGAPPGRTEVPSNLANLPAGWDEFTPELDRRADDHIVTKRTWGAFTNTDLEAYLKRRGVTQVVIAGIATSIGVESTARQARDLGFHVTLAIDAVTDTNAETHANSVTRIFPRLGETGTTGEILDLVGRGGG